MGITPTLTFTLDPEPVPALLDGLTDLWIEVANAGGAVGFAELPVARADVSPEVDRYAAALAEGRNRLLGGFGEDGRLMATAFLAFNARRLQRHWAWLYTVMIHPSLQGGGHGRLLLAEAERHARDLGLEALRLTCRGGLGLEDFYARCGYKEVGRVPAGLRVSAEDYRDDIMMLLPLT